MRPQQNGAASNLSNRVDNASWWKPGPSRNFTSTQQAAYEIARTIQDLFDIPARVCRIDVHHEANFVKFASFRVVSSLMNTPTARPAVDG
jgi:hypothetical protein